MGNDAALLPVSLRLLERRQILGSQWLVVHGNLPQGPRNGIRGLLPEVLKEAKRRLGFGFREVIDQRVEPLFVGHISMVPELVWSPKEPASPRRSSPPSGAKHYAAALSLAVQDFERLFAEGTEPLLRVT